MKKFIILFWAICCCSFAEAQAITDTLRVLAIGNSFSQDAVEQYLYELGREVGVEMIIGNGYRGGQGLPPIGKMLQKKITPSNTVR